MRMLSLWQYGPRVNSIGMATFWKSSKVSVGFGAPEFLRGGWSAHRDAIVFPLHLRATEKQCHRHDERDKATVSLSVKGIDRDVDELLQRLCHRRLGDGVIGRQSVEHRLGLRPSAHAKQGFQQRELLPGGRLSK